MVPEPPQRVLALLADEVTYLHYLWFLFRGLFMEDPSNVDLLNRHGSNVFWYLKRLMVNELALSLSKLTDQNRQGAHENLSLKQLTSHASESNEPEFAQELKKTFGVVFDLCQKFRMLRHKRIAHTDLEHLLGTPIESVADFTAADVESALKQVREFINMVERHYGTSVTLFQHTPVPSHRGHNALLQALRDADLHQGKR